MLWNTLHNAGSDKSIKKSMCAHCLGCREDVPFIVDAINITTHVQNIEGN